MRFRVQISVVYSFLKRTNFSDHDMFSYILAAEAVVRHSNFVGSASYTEKLREAVHEKCQKAMDTLQTPLCPLVKRIVKRLMKRMINDDDEEDDAEVDK